MGKITQVGLMAAAALALLGCTVAEDSVLPGKRETIAEAFGRAGDDLPENTARQAQLDTVRQNTAWAQSHATPSTRAAHPALSSSLDLAWSTSIGQGDTRRQRITAQPVAANGVVFTLDSAARVTATSYDGTQVWTRDLTPPRERADEATGGALALGGGRLYVASAFGRLSALDPATGAEIWTQRLGTTGTGAPTYYDGVVYIVSGDTTGWAIEADTGRLRWQIEALADINNVAGGPAPALTDKLAIFAFGSGELQATFRQGGLRLWNVALASRRDGLALALVDDITGHPVIRGNTVYAGNYSGSFTAIDVDDGTQKWTAPMGALGPAWVTRASVYLVSDLNELVRLDAKTGGVVWRSPLPGYIETRRPQAQRQGAYVHHGPLVAGSRVLVASSDGVIRAFAPDDGRLLAETRVPGGATSAPIAVDGTYYVVTSRGELAAFR